MPTIKTRLQLDAEKEFKSAVREINGELKTLNSEMKLVSATYQENSGSAEALTAKGEVLQRQLEQQKDKVRELNAALDNAKAVYGENSSQVQRWQQSLNNAQVDVLNTEKAIRDNGDALKGTTKAMGEFGDAETATGEKTTGLGDMVNGLTQKLGINLPQGVTDSLNSMVSLDAGMLGMVATCAAVVAAVYQIEKALIDLSNEQAAWAKETSNSAAQLNMSTEEYQQWDSVMKSVGYSMDQAKGDMSALAEKAQDAANGVGEGAEMFDLLGVSVTNGNGSMKTQSQLFSEVCDALNEMEDMTQRNAIASKLLSTTGEEGVIPMLEKYGSALDHVKDSANYAGEEQVQQLDELSNALGEFENDINIVKTGIAAEFAPSLERLYEVGSDVMMALGDALEKSGLVEMFGVLMEIVSALSPLFEVLFGELGSGIGNVIKPLTVALSLVADVLTVIVSAVAAIIESFKWLFGGGQESLGKINRYSANIERVFSNEGATARALGIGQNAEGTSDWRGGLTWVGERGPELVSLPAHSQIYSNEESKGIVGTNNYYMNVYPRDLQTAARMTATFERARQKARAK